jgi:hypothetical protein
MPLGPPRDVVRLTEAEWPKRKRAHRATWRKCGGIDALTDEQIDQLARISESLLTGLDPSGATAAVDTRYDEPPDIATVDIRRLPATRLAPSSNTSPGTCSSSSIGSMRSRYANAASFTVTGSRSPSTVIVMRTD